MNGDQSTLELRGSLRLRLLIGTLLWILASIVIAGWVLSGLFRQHVSIQFHDDLKSHLDQLAANLVVDESGLPALSTIQSDPRFSKPLSGMYWQIDRSGEKGQAEVGLLRSRSLWDVVLKAPIDSPMDGEVHQHLVSGPNGSSLGMVERVVILEDTYESRSNRYRLIVAADEKQMTEPVRRFNSMLWLALSLLGGALVLAAVFQVMVALIPLRKLRDALAAVREGRIQQLEGKFPGEIQPLVEELNTVLVQNADLVERARTQAGNLAHALKTPLSVVGNAVNGRPDELSLLVSTQIDVARKQIDYHLSRARVAASVGIPGVRAPLLLTLEGLVRAMNRIHAERNLRLLIHSNDNTVFFRGEEQDLQEILGNLLDNACKWAKCRVDVAFQIVGDHIQITVDDDGSGIALLTRERVLNRGERIDELMPGSGLGLSIVKELVLLYRGKLDLSDSPSGGLRVTIDLPTVHHAIA